MSKKIYGFIVLLLVAIITIGIYSVKNEVGDLRPAVLPIKVIDRTNTTEQVQGSSNIPLTIPNGFKIGIYAEELNTARDLQFSPGGTLIVSLMKEGRIVALPDKNNDGVADRQVELFSELDTPHGLAFYGGKLFVAEQRQVVRYKWDENNLKAVKEKTLFPLPQGARHTTRSLVFDQEGHLFVSIGSTCDVCEEKDERISTVLISDSEGKNPRVYAKGLRNAVFLQINEQTNTLWVTEMGRDFLGDGTPPDEVNIIQEGKNYGWPKCYGSNIHDQNFDKTLYKIRAGTTICEALGMTPSVYNIPAHSAPLGLTFIQSSQFPQNWQGDLLVAYHGSWNSSTPVGYKVVRMKVDGSTVLGEEDFITGFLSGNQTYGRPVDLTFDKAGSLYISDDKAGRIYKIVKN